MNEEKWTTLQQAEDMAYFKGRPLLLLARELQPGREEGNLQRHDLHQQGRARRHAHRLRAAACRCQEQASRHALPVGNREPRVVGCPRWRGRPAV